MEPIIMEVRGAIGCITLNRPAKYNSFTRELALALQAAIKTYAADDQVRVIYLTGAGKAFCAGQDLGEITPGRRPQPVDDSLGAPQSADQPHSGNRKTLRGRRQRRCCRSGGESGSGL